jgi:Family of unknown function (DUF6152)
MKRQHPDPAGMRGRLRGAWLVSLRLALLVGCGSSAWAHHSFAMYDSHKSVALQGTVKEFNFGNPHTLIVLVVKNGAGTTSDYTIETNGSFNLAKNHNWNRESLKKGEAVTALVYPLRDGSLGGDLLKITLSDGSELIARAPPYPPEEKK